MNKEQIANNAVTSPLKIEVFEPSTSTIEKMNVSQFSNANYKYPENPLNDVSSINIFLDDTVLEDNSFSTNPPEDNKISITEAFIITQKAGERIKAQRQEVAEKEATFYAILLNPKGDK
jgi:hypothetical protein